MRKSNIIETFFALVRAGLWGGDQRSVQEFNVQEFKDVDWNYIYRLALEQSVQGLVLQGIEELRAKNFELCVPQELLLQWIGEVQIIEQQNIAMNEFVAWLIEILLKENIYALLVKGQGIAQCYERPLRRACGDVDLFLSEDNFKKALQILSPLATSIEEENTYNKHIAMTIDDWSVELHGTLRSGLWQSLDRGLDKIQNTVFYEGKVRSWMNGHTQVFLPAADEDVVFVFAHILQHFYKEGIGLRQICDWCRLLWTYKDSLNHGLLESRIRKMGLMTEWKAFGSMAVNMLGMPVEAMPLQDSSKVDLSVETASARHTESELSSALAYSQPSRVLKFFADLRRRRNKKYKKKADRILEFVLETGNFGHNRDYSYQKKYPYIIYKTISFWKHLKDGAFFFSIFPLDSIKVTWRRLIVGVAVVLQGKKHE